MHNLRGDRGGQRRVLLSLSATSADTLGVIAAAPSLLGLGSQSVNRSLSVISLGHSQLVTSCIRNSTSFTMHG